jgi:hypothetical protein
LLKGRRVKRIAAAVTLLAMVFVFLPDARAGRVTRAARAAIEKPTRKLFKFLARKKSGRVLHDRGDAYSASLELAPGNPLGRSAGKVKVTVRMSRATGKPQPTSVPLGAAVRVPDGKGGADDLLMVSNGKGAVLRRLFWPRSSFFGATTYSSLLPFRIGGGRKQLIQLVPEDRAERPKTRAAGGATDLGELADAVERGAASFTLLSTPLHGSGQTIIGRLVLEEKLADGESRGLRFNPWANSSVKPAGFINWVIRRAAYRGSQAGR